MADKIKDITAVQDEETRKQIQDLVERLSQAQSAEELADEELESVNSGFVPFGIYHNDLIKK